MTKRTFRKYPSNYVRASRGKTQFDTVMELLEANNYSIPIDSDGGCDFKVVQVDRETFPDMPESLEAQLKQEDKYGDYVAIIMGHRPLTINELPIYGNSSRWVTKWIYPTPEAAVRQILGERSIALFKRIMRYPGNNVTASTNIYSTKAVWYLIDDFVTYEPLTNDNGNKLVFNSKEEAQDYIDKNGIDAVPHQHFEYSVYHPNYRRYNI